MLNERNEAKDLYDETHANERLNAKLNKKEEKSADQCLNMKIYRAVIPKYLIK